MDRRQAIETSSPAKPFAYVALGIGLVSIGFSAIFIRFAGVPGTVAAFYRMAIGLTALTPAFMLSLRGQRSTASRELRIAFLGGSFFAIDLAFWSTGVMLSGATNPTLLANTAPIWVGVGAMLVYKEKLPLLFWVGLVIAMTGAGLVMGFDAFQAMTLGLGSLLGMLAGIFYGIYFLVTQHGRQTLSALTYFWYSSLSATLVLLIINLLLRQPLLGYSSRAYLSLLGLGVLSQGIGWLAINYAQGHLRATLVAPTLLGQPVVTALLAGPLLGEQLTWIGILGGATVLTGIYIVHRSRTNPHSQKRSVEGV
ncbi:MAG: DMT family transporter [Anaerolineales bacterium]|nr:MAG: DMT family transporter [Anaerolineales bacterium]